eukprot:501693-Amphidinium_carterae.1
MSARQAKVLNTPQHSKSRVERFLTKGPGCSAFRGSWLGSQQRKSGRSRGSSPRAHSKTLCRPVHAATLVTKILRVSTVWQTPVSIEDIFCWVMRTCN